LQAFLADVGQNENFAEVEKKALALGAERMIIENLQQEFVDELIFPAIQCTSRFRLYQHILLHGRYSRKD
jgi:argininosuccinate synthase